MRDFLLGEYRGVIFEEGGEVVAYALYREQPEEIYLRQLFVVPGPASPRSWPAGDGDATLADLAKEQAADGGCSGAQHCCDRVWAVGYIGLFIGAGDTDACGIHVQN